jgi:hypothetical protein
MGSHGMVALSWLCSPGGGNSGQSGSTSIGAVGDWACGGDVVLQGGVGDRRGDTTICGVSACGHTYPPKDDGVTSVLVWHCLR